jgi:hypothetical protein
MRSSYKLAFPDPLWSLADQPFEPELRWRWEQAGRQIWKQNTQLK